MATAAFGVTASAAGTAQRTIATALHIAAADADPTPNLDALAVSIAARSQSGAKQFDIRLDPPELGRVEVRLSIDATGKARRICPPTSPRRLTCCRRMRPP